MFLGVFFLANLKLSKDPVKKFLKKETTFKELTQEVRTNYTSDDFSKKTSFIDLNGLSARVIGNRECNDVILLKNNMLSQVIEKTDMEKQANAIIGLADYTKQLGIPFLYVQAPYEEDMEGTLYPTGRESYGNENADELLQLLGEGQVDIYDLRPMLSKTAEQVEQYFFRTDHHWKFCMIRPRKSFCIPACLIWSMRESTGSLSGYLQRRKEQLVCACDCMPECRGPLRETV